MSKHYLSFASAIESFFSLIMLVGVAIVSINLVLALNPSAESGQVAGVKAEVGISNLSIKNIANFENIIVTSENSNSYAKYELKFRNFLSTNDSYEFLVIENTTDTDITVNIKDSLEGQVQDLITYKLMVDGGTTDSQILIKAKTKIKVGISVASQTWINYPFKVVIEFE